MRAGRAVRAAAAGLAAAVALGAFLLWRAAPGGYVLKVNGSTVHEAEFQLLLRENRTTYERELREAVPVPEEQDMAEALGAEHFRALLLERNTHLLTQLRVEQALCVRYGVAGEFTYEGFLEEMERENQRRKDALAAGEPVYGLRSFTPGQYYSYRMSNLRTALIEAIPEADLGITGADAIDYYRKLDTYAHLDGERIRYTLCDVTDAQGLPEEAREALYREIKSALERGAAGTYTAGELRFSCEERVFTANELREFLRQDFDAEFLLALDRGEVTGAFSLGGKTYLARYEGFSKAEVLTQGETEAFLLRLREEAYQEMLTQEIACADVSVNESYMDRCAREGEVPRSE